MTFQLDTSAPPKDSDIRAAEREQIARFINPHAFNPSVMNPEDRPDLVANAQAYALERADQVLAYLDSYLDRVAATSK